MDVEMDDDDRMVDFKVDPKVNFFGDYEDYSAEEDQAHDRDSEDNDSEDEDIKEPFLEPERLSTWK